MAKNVQVRWFLETPSYLTCTGGHFVLLCREVFACCATVTIFSLVKCVVEWGCRFDGEGQGSSIVSSCWNCLMIICHVTAPKARHGLHFISNVSRPRIASRSLASSKEPSTALRSFRALFILSLRKTFIQCLRSWIGLSLLQVLLDPLICFFVNLLALCPVVASRKFVSYTLRWNLLNRRTVLLCLRFIVWRLFISVLILLRHDFETIESVRKVASNWLVTDRRNRRNCLVRAIFDWSILPQWSFKLVLIATEGIGALLDCETTVIAEDVGVATCAVLSVDDDVWLDIVSHSFVAAQRVEGPRILGNIGSWWGHLVGRGMPNRETAVIVGDIFIAIVATLAEAFLEAITFVD